MAGERSPTAPVEADRPDGEMPATPNPNYMLSLARGLAVLRAFGDGGGARTITELARQSGIPAASVRRCLLTLCELGYVRRDRTAFELTPSVLALGYAYIGSTGLARAAQPILDRASGDLGESCSIAQLDGDAAICVARVETQRIISIGVPVGSRLPAWCTATGRVLLAGLEPRQLSQVLKRVTAVAYTPETITDRALLAKVVQQVTVDGFALVDQEFEVGLRSLAVPVHAGRDVVAALNVDVQASRGSLTVLEREFLPTLRRAAANISRSLPNIRNCYAFGSPPASRRVISSTS